MKKFFFFWILLLFAPLAMQAQNEDFQAPDYDAIHKKMTDDPNLYPSIEARFLNADLSLTDEEIGIFYFGKVFRDDYSPYHNIEWTKNIRDIMTSDNIKSSILKKELKNIDKTLSEYPVSLECIFIKYVICLELYGQGSKEEQRARFMVSALLNTIFATGDGSSMESAIHVSHVPDEHTLMQLGGLRWKSQSLHENDGQIYDSFELEENEDGIEELYFNITPCFNAHSAELRRASSSENEFSNRIEIPLGTRVTLRLKEDKKGTFQAAIIDQKPFSGEVNEATFSSENNSDIVELVFTQEKVYGGKEKVVLCAKSFNDKALAFDSSIQYHGKKTFESTSNVGWFPKAFMQEQWQTGIVKIRLENIRIMKQ